MPRPDVILGEDTRAGMLRGFQSMAQLLAITLGPIGGNIAYDRQGSTRGPEIIRDAATVIRRIIQIPGRVEDAGAMIMRQLVWNTREHMGDGSATAAVLASAIAKEMERLRVAEANTAIMRRGIEKAVIVALAELDRMAMPLDSEERISAVATAATGNTEIGQILGEMYDVLGPDANIITQPYIATFHDRAYHEGARFKGGYLSPYFQTDESRRIVALDNPYILVGDVAFNSIEAAHHILTEVLEKGEHKSLLVICKLVTDKVIGMMIKNNEAGTVQSAAAKSLSLGDVRTNTFENLCTLTGATPLEQIYGDSGEITASLSNAVTLGMLGRAERVIVAQDHFVIIGGKGDQQAIKERRNDLRKQLRQTLDGQDRKDLREVLAHFSAGIGELRLGALTDKERQDLQTTAEQAMRAVDVAMEGGIVPGGGVAYLRCVPAVEKLADELEGDEAFGARVVARALEEPLRRIAINSGAHPPIVIDDVLRAGEGYGFDARTKQIVNVHDAGIMDPLPILKHALEMAASGAVMLLSTEALVLHRNPKETFNP